MKNLHPPKKATWLLYCAFLQVYWNSGAKHRGGYAYRLCKVNNGKYWHVTEECFQRGHLKFHGDSLDITVVTSSTRLTEGNLQWIYWHPNDDYFHEEGWIPNQLVTTTEGTTPKHSEWAKIDVHSNPHEGDAWAFKDLVEVPEDLEPGDYVLSFRWDCQRTPQVWNSCANIKIE